MLGCCLISFHFLWAILCPQAVLHFLLAFGHLAFGSYIMLYNLIWPTCEKNEEQHLTFLEGTEKAVSHELHEP